MRIPRVLFLLPLTVSVACGGSSSNKPTTITTPYSVGVTSPKVVELTKTATIALAVTPHPSYDDSDDDDSGPYFSCNSADPGPISVLPDLKVTGATCSSDCTVAVGLDSLAVTAQAAGEKVIVVSYTTSDIAGEQRMPITIEFRKATKIVELRDATSPSGTAFAMIPNDTQTWTLGVGDDAGTLDADPCEIHVSIDGVLAQGDSGTCDTLVLQAQRPGTGTITTTYRDLVRTQTVTVIDPRDASIAELRHVAVGAQSELLDVDTDTRAVADAEDPFALHYRCAPESVVVRLETITGVIAYGGAGTLATSP